MLGYRAFVGLCSHRFECLAVSFQGGALELDLRELAVVRLLKGADLAAALLQRRHVRRLGHRRRLQRLQSAAQTLLLLPAEDSGARVRRAAAISLNSVATWLSQKDA